jgi:integrase
MVTKNTVQKEDKRSQKVRFTRPRIANLSCPPLKSQAFLWDSYAPGLGVRATPNSPNKVFVFQDRFNGKTFRVKLGSVLTLTIEAAQEEANRMMSLLRRGIDPRQEKAEKIAIGVQKNNDEAARLAKESATVASAWHDYYQEKSRSKKDGKFIWGDKHKAHLAHFLQPGGAIISRGKRPAQSNVKRPGILYPLMRLKLSELDEEIISSWLKKESSRAPTSTAKAYSVLRAFINWCSKDKQYKAIIKADSIKSDQVRDNLIPSRPKKNDSLRKAQISLWFKEVKKISNPIICSYLQCLLLTGSRRNELATLKWKDVDLKWKSLTIRDKVEGERTIPLTPYVEFLIQALPRQNQYVFSSTLSKSGRIEEPRKQHSKAISNAGLPPLSLHGLRRSFGTLSEWVEVPTGIVAQIMGHKPSAIAEKHYIQRELDLLEIWHIKIEKWILNEAKIKFTPSKSKLKVAK